MSDDIEEFIQRCKNPEFQKIVDENHEEKLKIQRQRISRWNNNNREYLRECIKKYSKTEKGRYTCSKRNVKRQCRKKDASMNLDNAEKLLIGEFYANCPADHHVDHIVPLSKGGKHRLSNLQYLHKTENSQKGGKLLVDPDCEIRETAQYLRNKISIYKKRLETPEEIVSVDSPP